MVGSRVDAETLTRARAMGIGDRRESDLTIYAEPDGTISVDMGAASLRGDGVASVTVGDRTRPALGLEVPNPHAVVLVEDLASRLATNRQGGPERARVKHVERGKLLLTGGVSTIAGSASTIPLRKMPGTRPSMLCTRSVGAPRSRTTSWNSRKRAD